MKIAVDLDGVCYEWERTARYMLRTSFPAYADSLAIESLGWDYIKGVVKPEHWKWLWNQGVDQGLFRYGHVVKDCIFGVKALADDHEIHIVTHRPKPAIADTLAWLNYTQLPISGLHILTKGEPKTTIDFDLLVDDKPSNVDEAIYEHRYGCLFRRAWNQGHDVPSVAGWLVPGGVIDYVNKVEDDLVEDRV